VRRNARVGRGEIDLLAIIDGERAAVEVKTVIASASSDPIFNFNADKENQVRALASCLEIWRIDYLGLELSPDGVMVHWLPRV
jgi:Holliday junction resolvase-like predicted endonuclease